jgi:hypothetical protein
MLTATLVFTLLVALWGGVVQLPHLRRAPRGPEPR